VTVAQILRANVLTRFNAILGVLFVVPVVVGPVQDALELPPASVCAWVACVVLAAIAGLTCWRRVRSAASRLAPNTGACQWPS